MTDLDARKTQARAWFESLRDRIMAAFEALEDEAPASLYPGAPGRFANSADAIVTGFPVRMDLGVDAESTPISVAHVSAVAAPMAPAASAIHNGASWTRLIAAAEVKTPPLASTCQASRFPPFSTMLRIRSDFRSDL